MWFNNYYNLKCLTFQSNTKAELMTKLDESATMMKSLAESESSLKSQVNTMQEGIKERDRNIQRMKDQMKHYVAFAETSALGRQNDDEIAYLQDNYNKLMTDLVDAKEEIRCLNSHNSELKGQLEVLSSQTRESSMARPTPDAENGHHEDLSTGSPSTSSSSASSSSIDDGSEKIPMQITQDLTTSSNIIAKTECQQVNGIPPLSKDVALLKVEAKFNEAMEKIATLTSEKEQLEHIVIRLQEETDTVGKKIVKDNVIHKDM